MHVVLKVNDPGAEDMVARRLMADLSDSSDIESAELVTRAADTGEKGIIEELGLVAVTFMEAVGVETLLDVAKSVLPRRRPLSDDERTLEIEIEGKGRVVITGGMTDDEFREKRDQILAFMIGQDGAPT